MLPATETMIQKIITHPGGAHKDDVIAVCILVAMHGAPVVRRNPTDNELDDPHIAVLDIGGSDDSSKSNFDHHQYPREHEPTCSLSLVLQHLGLYEDARIVFDWLEPAEWFDSRGPNRKADVHFAHQERLHVQDVGNRAGTTAGVSRGCVESGLSSLSRRSTIATVSPRSVRRSADLRATDSSVGRCGFAPATRTARARAPAAQGARSIPVSLVDPKCRSAEFLDSTASGRLRAPDSSSQCDNARPTP